MRHKFTYAFVLFAIFLFGVVVDSVFAKDKNFMNLKPNLVVAKDGSGNFKTIKEALENIPKDNSSLFVVLIKNGLYEEKILIDKNFVVLMGESREATKIIYAEQKRIWECINDPNNPLPAVVNITGSDCTLLNLTMKNNWGELHQNDTLPKLNCDMDNSDERFKPNGHQYAFKLSGDATKLVILNCNIIAAGADTFCPWNKETGMYFIKDTYFEGYTDYVCPRGDCYITDSEFYCKGGVATLWHDGSSSKDKKFVIVNSRFDGVKDFKLGRYTHDAQIILINSTFSKNMADKNIYQAKPDVQWGERIYYYNCKRDGEDYSWHKNNFGKSGYLPSPDKITPVWTFNGKWDPEKFIKENNLTTHYK